MGQIGLDAPKKSGPVTPYFRTLVPGAAATVCVCFFNPPADG